MTEYNTKTKQLPNSTNEAKEKRKKILDEIWRRRVVQKKEFAKRMEIKAKQQLARDEYEGA